MKVEIIPPSTVEADEVVGSGKGLSMRPLFYGSGLEAATAAVVKVHDAKGELVYMGMLKVSGKGKPSLQERTRPVKPVIDRDEVVKK